jgi:hypothetical protein
MENSDLVTFSIFINDKETDPANEIISVEVYQEANEIASAILTIAESFIPDEMQAVDSPDFTPGNTITIKAGYSGNNEIIFNGIITGNEISLPRNEAPLFLVECKSTEAAKPVAKAEPVLELAYGDSIFSFEAKIDMKTPGINGGVKFQGSSLVIPGAIISLKGIGSKFSGYVPVVKVDHSIKNGLWTTDATFGS